MILNPSKVIAILSLLSIQAYASEVIVNNYQIPFADCFKGETYVSGEECYLKYNKPEYNVSGWQFLEVPIDYKSNLSHKTKISFRLSPGFSAEKKTVIYFNGGPGGSSHDTEFNALEDVNIIYFNQRGSAFSRPETKELFLNQNYYSSENTARDALEIIKHLGINQVTVYGMSYGTVPATIFGSLFPEYSRNVILEGVVFDGKSRLWYSNHRINLMQKYFDKLDESMKEKILKYSQHPNVFEGWFSSLAQPLMYSSNFENALTSKLSEIFTQDSSISAEEFDKYIVERLKMYSYNSASDFNDMIYFSPAMFNFIACKELDAEHELSSFFSIFNENQKLIPYVKNSSQLNVCKNLNISQSKTYSAIDYPLHVPTYYFQGTTDGATTADFAIWHYKESAKQNAQIVLAKKVGHSVVIEHLIKRGELSEEEKKNPALVLAHEKKLATQQEVIKLFKAAVNNENLNLSKLNQLIDDKKSEWVKTEK